MRLVDLKPEWVEKSATEEDPRIDRYIEMNCPRCLFVSLGESETRSKCCLLIPVGQDGNGDASKATGPVWSWNKEEDFEKLTMTPSIYHHCKGDAHFFIRDGEIQFA